MKKIDIIARVALIVIAAASLVAIVLQILNERTNGIETTYEIITFTVSIMALTLAVFASLDGLRHSRELKVMAHEMRETLREIRALDKESENLEREVSHELRIDEEILHLLREHGVGDDSKRHDIAKQIRKVAQEK